MAATAIGRQKVVLPHETEHPAAAHLDAIPNPEPGPHLAVPPALKQRSVQIRPDQYQDLVI